MGRAPCCDKVGLKKGPWTPEEDQTLISFIQHHGHSNWRALPKQAGLLRCGKSCRLRWINYLRPDIKRGNFSREEEDTIIQLHEMLGNRWSAIAARLPGRTDNEIKNVWHTHLKKRLKEYQPTKSHAKMAKKCHDANKKKAPATTTTTTTDDSSSGYSFPESTSDHIANSGSPQQSSLTSDDMSSSGTEVSSIEVPSDASFIINVQTFDNSIQQSANLDYLPIIDETFWEPQDLLPSLDASEFDSIIEDNDQMVQFETFFSEQEQKNNSINVQVYHNNAGLVNYGDAEDNMDFWLDVFVQAGGAPELPEF